MIYQDYLDSCDPNMQFEIYEAAACSIFFKTFLGAAFEALPLSRLYDW